MKNKSWLLVLLVLLCVSFAFAAEVPGDVKVSLISQEPDPVEPGGYVDLRFKIENFGTTTLKDVFVSLENQFPITLAGDKPEKFLGSLWGGLNGDYGVVVKYRVKIADNAADGATRVTVMTKSDGGEWSSTDLSITVRSIFDQIFIQKIVTEPEIIQPGQEVKVSFEIANLGTTAMRDITLSLDLSGTTLPFVPSGELAQKRIPMLRSSEVSTISFNIRADPKATSQLYKIPLSLEYYDSLNNLFTKTDVLGLEVGGKPQLFVGLDQSTVYTAGTTGDVVVSIVNNGETDVKFLKVDVPTQNGYIIIEGAEQYIGNLNSDDFETVKLRIHLKDTASKFELPVSIEYKDSLGNSYEETRIVEVPFYSKTQAFQLGLLKKSSTLGVVIFIVLVLVGIFVYRRLKKRRK